MTDDAGVVLRSDVEIEPISARHAANMLRWMGDPVVSTNIGLRGEPSIERTEAWIEAAVADASVAAFAVLSGGRHVGNVVLDRIDRYLNNARLSIYLGEADVRGSGVAITGMHRVMAEAFGPMSLHKIWLTVHTKNHAGINTYTRLGFSLEGVLRDEFLLNGTLVNVFYMGILKSEFERLPVRTPNT
jgi:RimJ/RimL family protein N-acetyltransferase